MGWALNQELLGFLASESFEAVESWTGVPVGQHDISSTLPPFVLPGLA